MSKPHDGGVSALVPEHVLSAFQAESDRPQALGPAWDHGVLIGTTVFAPATSTSVWSAKVRDKISIDGVRVSRPARATDGRFIVGGYKASDFIEGETACRVDETIAAALRFDDAMAVVEAPPAGRDDHWARADAVAWGDADWDGPVQVCHADFLACTIHAGTLPPALTDIVPTGQLRPHGYTAALVLVDALIVRAVDAAVVDRWAHIPDMAQLTECALRYREALAGEGLSNESSNFERVWTLLMSEGSATI
ncbi:hypothetical protein [Corynebacterium cystitidis]|uniref:hypothetical protein n=1 Tax=Corynebacterium cystitidis TaxID=35757 RepID=UPI00211EB147|nr:hypothetical protein [Corynebacterium cystitidis]